MEDEWAAVTDFFCLMVTAVRRDEKRVHAYIQTYGVRSKPGQVSRNSPRSFLERNISGCH